MDEQLKYVGLKSYPGGVTLLDGKSLAPAANEARSVLVVTPTELGETDNVASCVNESTTKSQSTMRPQSAALIALSGEISKVVETKPLIHKLLMISR